VGARQGSLAEKAQLVTDIFLRGVLHARPEKKL